MPAHLYFELKAVLEHARFAVLADYNLRTEQEAATDASARPALWYFREGGQVHLHGNGFMRHHLQSRGPASVPAQSHAALTTPAVRPRTAATPPYCHS
ncbi:hypothetical protein [Dactylosporangium cerinum]